MIPPVPNIEKYDITEQYGFLPPDLPLERLPDWYYAPWEAVVSKLQALILSRRFRETARRMPILSTSRLQSEAEWRRAYVILAFFTHAYMWGGDQPAEVRFPEVTSRYRD
jgi:indoleamine 2,3-dioxygenase